MFPLIYNKPMLKRIHILKATVFLSAFLLFQIELIATKILLPHFGGSYLVWGAACVFFQAVLLAGYLYSHLILSRLQMARYRFFHIGLFVFSLIFFPGRQLPNVYPLHNLPLVINIFLQLTFLIGPAFLILSTTNIILHSWLASSNLAERKNPYVLYGISNFGSFAGILTYPFFFEPAFDLDRQILIWRIGYFILIGLHLVALKFIKVENTEISGPKPFFVKTPKKDLLYWFLLSAAGVIMFLSVTNILTYEVAPIPLLWIVPLSIYLLSFILNFKKKPWCPQWIHDKIYLTIGFSVLIFFMAERLIIPFEFMGSAFLISLFILCMYCASLLNGSKPEDPERLSVFYVVISVGGFLGGILVSWVAPLINTLSMIEYLIGLVCISFALRMQKKEAVMGFSGLRLIVYSLFLLILWPMAFENYNVFGIIFIIIAFNYTYSRFKAHPKAFNIGLISILCLIPTLESLWTDNFPIFQKRNYYGIYKIYDDNGTRILMHGMTLHGAQYIFKEKKKETLTYYHPLTPAGELMQDTDFKTKKNIGIIGLGTATLISYTNKDQTVDYFELDADMIAIAKNYFTFLKDSPSKINILLGDARISIKQVPDRRYDLLIIDAFNGDSIPIHLLTVEALREYRRCIADNGTILFHISNRYLDLNPVLLSNACVLNAHFCQKSNEPKGGRLYASSWVALTWDQASFNKLLGKHRWDKFYPEYNCRNFRPWKDNYSNLTRVIEFKKLSLDIKNFTPFYW